MSTILGLIISVITAREIWFSCGSFQSEDALDCSNLTNSCLSGAWLILPSYMIYEFGAEIFEILASAADSATSSVEDNSLVKVE